MRYQRPIPMTPAVMMNHVPTQGPLIRNGLPGHIDEPTQQSTAYENAPNIKHRTPANRSDLISIHVSLAHHRLPNKAAADSGADMRGSPKMRLSDAGLGAVRSRRMKINARRISVSTCSIYIVNNFPVQDGDFRSFITLQ